MANARASVTRTTTMATMSASSVEPAELMQRLQRLDARVERLEGQGSVLPPEEPPHAAEVKELAADVRAARRASETLLEMVAFVLVGTAVWYGVRGLITIGAAFRE